MSIATMSMLSFQMFSVLLPFFLLMKSEKYQLFEVWQC
uniref:Uncharacterized protein n=1 Tax=Rhizophora mucronata TaxID=61149 RepID=A0A2P2PAQ3_RHIMU